MISFRENDTLSHLFSVLFITMSGSRPWFGMESGGLVLCSLIPSPALSSLPLHLMLIWPALTSLYLLLQWQGTPRCLFQILCKTDTTGLLHVQSWEISISLKTKQNKKPLTHGDSIFLFVIAVEAFKTYSFINAAAFIFHGNISWIFVQIFTSDHHTSLVIHQ